MHNDGGGLAGVLDPVPHCVSAPPAWPGSSPHAKCGSKSITSILKQFRMIFVFRWTPSRLFVPNCQLVLIHSSMAFGKYRIKVQRYTVKYFSVSIFILSELHSKEETS